MTSRANVGGSINTLVHGVVYINMFSAIAFKGYNATVGLQRDVCVNKARGTWKV